MATVKGTKSTKGLNISGKKITLKNTALSSEVTVSGKYKFYFASDYKKATITGSSSIDSITARGKNLYISVGKGNDTVKIFGSATTVKGGANVIRDYAAEDEISIASGTAKVTTSGSNVILTAGKCIITVENGNDKTVTERNFRCCKIRQCDSDDRRLCSSA